MSDTNTLLLSRIDRDMLTPLVRQALNRPTIDVVDWDSQAIAGGAGAYEEVV